MAFSLFELIPLPFGGYFFLGIPPEYTDVERTLSVFMIVATLLFGFTLSATMGNHGDVAEIVMPLFYQAVACFGYLVMLILCTYMYFATHVHQENAQAMRAEMAAFRYVWALLVTIMLAMFILGTFMFFWGVSYIRDDRVGREIGDEVYLGNTWQNCFFFSMIVLVTHTCFVWVRWKSDHEVTQSGLWDGITDDSASKEASGEGKETQDAKDPDSKAKAKKEPEITDI